MSVTKAESKTKIEAARGDWESNKSIAARVVAELGGGVNKELAYRAQHGDTGAALILAATLPT